MASTWSRLLCYGVLLSLILQVSGLHRAQKEVHSEEAPRRLSPVTNHAAGALTFGADTEEVESTGSWCTDRVCLSAWEKSYMLSNSEALASGLQKLREPGCVPKGRKILTGGYYRTGSTQLFNQVRLWMGLAFPGKIAAGFLPSNDQLGALDKTMTVVSKQHELTHERAQAFDVLLMSRRAVVETVISRLDTHSKLKLDKQHLTLENVTRACESVLSQQGAIYRTWESTGKKVAYDVLLEDWLQEPEKAISAIAEALGVCEAAREDKELLKFVYQMTDHLRGTDGYQPYSSRKLEYRLTQMNDFETEEYKAPLRPKVLELIEQEPHCSEWAHHDAHVESNCMYRKPAPASDTQTATASNSSQSRGGKDWAAKWRQKLMSWRGRT